MVVVVDGVDFMDANHVRVEEGGGWVIFFGGFFVSLDFGDHVAHEIIYFLLLYVLFAHLLG